MTYIKIEDKQFYNFNNLRKITSVSGEVIGNYDIEVKGNLVKFDKIKDEKTSKININKVIESEINEIIPKNETGKYRKKCFEVSFKKVNIVLDENVIELNDVNYPIKIDNICHNALWDIDNNIIIKKLSEHYLVEAKEKIKNKLVEKSKNDPGFVFDKDVVKDEYKKIFKNIENCNSIDELNLIEI